MNNADATSAFLMSSVNIVSPADQTDTTATSDTCIAITVSPGNLTDAAASLPDCWNTMQQGWIDCSQQETCSSFEFQLNRQTAESKPQKRLQTLCKRLSGKKTKEHFSSKAHKLCVKQEEYHACGAITKGIDKRNEGSIVSTCSVFNTVYCLADRCRPFSDIKDQSELQIRNELILVLDFIFGKLE